MASKIAICNLALSNIGKRNIQSLSDQDAEARACNQYYDHTLETLLAAQAWRFARQTVALAQLSSNPHSDRFAYAYQRPGDCLKFLAVVDAYDSKVRDDGGGVLGLFRYGVEGETIYCNISPAYGRFISKMSDATKLPPAFAEALSWHLAVRLAMPLTKDPKVRADAYQLAMAMQAKAAADDANEERTSSKFEPEMIEARA